MNISELLRRLSVDFASLTSGDKVVGGLVVTLLCMTIVFAVLIVLMFIIKGIRVFGGGSKNADEKPAPAPAPAPVQAAPVSTEDEDETAAVIAAVLAMAGGSGGNLVVRNIVRVSDQATQWSKTGPNPGITGLNGWN